MTPPAKISTLLAATFAIVGAPAFVLAWQLGNFSGQPTPPGDPPIGAQTGDVLTVRVLKQEAEAAAGEWTYYAQAQALALDRTEKEFGRYEFEVIDLPMEQDRSLRSLAEGRFVDVTWTMTSTEREASLRPIRIPLLKGLLGYRLFLIRNDDRRFDSIRTAEELAPMQAGQGVGWPDVDILQAGGLSVQTGHDFEGLFGMLERGRFDYSLAE